MQAIACTGSCRAQLTAPVDACALACAETSEALTQLQGCITERQQGADKAISDVATALEASIQQQQQALLQQIHGMVGAFAEQRSREVSRALQEVRQQVASDMGSVSERATGIQGAVTTSAGSLKVRWSQAARAGWSSQSTGCQGYTLWSWCSA